MRRTARAMIGIAAALTAVGAGVATAETASAVTPQCYQQDYQLFYTTANGSQQIVNLPASNSYSHNCILGISSYRHATVALQAALVDCYGKNIAIDGEFGNATKNALKSVQRAVGVDDDGVYGPVTGKKMKWPITWGAVSSNPGAFIRCDKVTAVF